LLVSGIGGATGAPKPPRLSGVIGRPGVSGCDGCCAEPIAGQIAIAAAATSNKPETVEQRITQLKAALKITPDQESKWNAVAQAMRENAASMEKLVASKRAIAPASMTAVDDLKTYQEFTQARLDGLKNLTSSFKSLYDSMPADQKKNADQVFRSYGPTNSASQG